MDGSETPVHIDHGELVAHQQRLRGLLDRINTAGEASDQAGVGQMAFGAIGQATLLGVMCANAESDGVEMLRRTHEATEDHIGRVGSWASDWAGHEGDAVALFDGATVSRG